MLDSIVQTLKKPPGLPDRAARLDVRNRVLDGTIYDSLPHQFSDETSASGEYIPIKQRKPSVRYNICRMVVEDSVSMLFGEGRFPSITCEDEATKDLIADLIDESNLAEIMVDAATRGSVGSIAILMRILKGRVFWQVMPTLTLTPRWDPEEPDRLLDVTERYQVPGKTLQGMGYPLTDDQAAMQYWFQRVWDINSETWFQPLSVEDDNNGIKPKVDLGRTVLHQLGFCPVYWVRNLPGGDQIDGGCTFLPAMETQIEIEYRLSQGGRALHYASDPLMMIREPASSDGDLVRSASNAIVVSKDGDAKMLEIDGAASAAVVEFCKALRDIAIETMHGNRANPDKLASAQSGRAMELLYQPLINLTDRLRHSYGRAVLRLMQMVIAANVRIPLRINEVQVPMGRMAKQRLLLQWGPYFPATIHDKQAMSQTLGQLKRDGLISRETAVEQVADFEDIADASAEIARIEADITAQDARLATQPGVQFKANATEEQ